MLGKIEGRRNKGTTEDEMAGWHHQLSGHGFEHFSMYHLSSIIIYLRNLPNVSICLSIIYLWRELEAERTRIPTRGREGSWSCDNTLS